MNYLNSQVSQQNIYASAELIRTRVSSLPSSLHDWNKQLRWQETTDIPGPEQVVEGEREWDGFL